MPCSYDVLIRDLSLDFIPVQTRVPLKFGTEVLASVTCSRVCIEVEGRNGSKAKGWGETPLSVQWVWPSEKPYAERHQALIEFSTYLSKRWTDFESWGHCLEIGHRLIMKDLPMALKSYNQSNRSGFEPLPWLAALVCSSSFDLALHDAYGVLHSVPTYQTYQPEFLSTDLSAFLDPAPNTNFSFRNRYPADFLVLNPRNDIPVWHLVGGLDPLDSSDLNGSEPEDGYPVHLREWIERDGLNCLKIKLRGNDADWDFQRILSIGRLAEQMKVDHLTVDFNCTVTDPAYVNQILDQLKGKHLPTHSRILYVEQPFPYDLEENRIDVRSVSARKPLFMDESAHDWLHISLGRELGWTGVALKTCKTQTGAILSLCWAKAHGMQVMVQDLTNPMLAQVPHVLLGAHAGTIMGVESNAMQFYPEASSREARIHPELYRRRNGVLNISSLHGPGFGYRMPEIMLSS